MCAPSIMQVSLSNELWWDEVTGYSNGGSHLGSCQPLKCNFKKEIKVKCIALMMARDWPTVLWLFG